MKFHQLTSVEKSAQSLLEKRQQSANECYQKGLREFADSVAADFQNKEVLKNAFDAFIEAIRHNRNNPDPYIAIGYLFIILNDPRSATLYLNQALKADPDNPDARLFLNHLQQDAQQKLARPALAGPPKPTESINYDQLYDQTEALIYSQVRLLMAEPPPQPSLDSASLKKLKDAHQQLTGTYALLQEQLAIIDQEIEISDLKNQLKPLEAMLKRWERTLADSENMLSLSQRIQDTHQAISAHLQNLAVHNLALPETELESWLDQCDAVADELDALEKQGIPITALEKTYNQLIAQIEKYQDRLDELQS